MPYAFNIFTNELDLIGSVSGGTGDPAGSNTQIQYNNSGVFGASSKFTFDSTSNTTGKFGLTVDQIFLEAGNPLGSEDQADFFLYGLSSTINQFHSIQYPSNQRSGMAIWADDYEGAFIFSNDGQGVGQMELYSHGSTPGILIVPGNLGASTADPFIMRMNAAYSINSGVPGSFGRSMKFYAEDNDQSGAGGSIVLNSGRGSPNGIVISNVGTDQNFIVQSKQLLANGVAFSSVNDANSANQGFEVRGSIVQMTTIGTNPIIFSIDQSEQARIAGNGNVGIHQTSPINYLDINTQNSSGVVIGSTGDDYSGVASAPVDGLIVEGQTYIGSPGDDGSGLKLQVTGGMHVSGGMSYFGTGWFINLSGDGSYMLATAAAGYNAGFTAHRSGLTQGQYCSFDLLENSTGSSGWSIQMKPSDSNLAILDRVNGNNLLYFHAGGGTDVYNKFTKYDNIATTGKGIPSIYGYARAATGRTAAVASVATYTLPAADGSFLISANVLVTTSTLHNFTVTVAYTDDGNTARTETLPFSVLAGTFITAITNASGAVPYTGIPIHIRAKASTAITIATTGTFTTVTYNVEGSIIQIA